jgi:hypothetical protein
MPHHEPQRSRAATMYQRTANGLQKSPNQLAQVFEAEDFSLALTPELREQEERMRAQLHQRKTS